MIGRKKQCRSAQTRHLFKKPVRSKSGAHSPFPRLLLVATSGELIKESPWKGSKADVRAKVTRAQRKKGKEQL